MECRVCFSSDPPLLAHLCGCRGTQGHVHAACLKAWLKKSPTSTCTICLEPWVLPWMQPRPQAPAPRAAALSTSQGVTSLIFLANLLLIGSLTPLLYARVILWIQRVLFAAYTWSYSVAILPWLRDPVYRRAYCRAWLRLWIFYENRLWFPLGSLVTALLSLCVPGILLFTTPYTNIWFLHTRIVRHVPILMTNNEILDTM